MVHKDSTDLTWQTVVQYNKEVKYSTIDTTLFVDRTPQYLYSTVAFNNA